MGHTADAEFAPERLEMPGGSGGPPTKLHGLRKRSHSPPPSRRVRRVHREKPPFRESALTAARRTRRKAKGRFPFESAPDPGPPVASYAHIPTAPLLPAVFAVFAVRNLLSGNRLSRRHGEHGERQKDGFPSNPHPILDLPSRATHTFRQPPSFPPCDALPSIAPDLAKTAFLKTDPSSSKNRNRRGVS